MRGSLFRVDPPAAGELMDACDALLPAGRAGTGITAAAAAHIIAAWLSVCPLPLTRQLAWLSGRPVMRLEVKDAGRTSDGQRWRTGRLVTEDGLVAADVSLTWAPGLIPPAARADLDLGKRPAGLILGSLPGFARRYLSAMAEGAEVRSAAQLYACGVQIGTSGEVVTAELCAAAAAYWDANLPGSY